MGSGGIAAYWSRGTNSSQVSEAGAWIMALLGTARRTLCQNLVAEPC